MLSLGAALLLAYACSAKVKEYKLQVVNEYSHSTESYTQGLFFHDGRLYESTGQYGASGFHELEARSGKQLRGFKLNRKYFGEGSVIFDGKLYILTWTNRLAFVYDAQTLKYERSVSYPREGWGLCTDGTRLIASDGSSKIYFLDAELKVQGSIDVTMNARPLRNINELEWIDGKIWANVYLTDAIVIIDPVSGRVEAVVDCGGLLPAALRDAGTDVLNGIAYDGERIFLTGKNWPRLYEVKLITD